MTDRILRAFLPYLIASASHLVLLVTGPGWAITATKATLMPLLAFAAVVLLRPRRDAPVVLLLAALGASWVGDVLLSFRGDVWFVAGLLGFLSAHVAYLLLFVRLGRSDRGPTSSGRDARRMPHPIVLAAYAVWFAVFLAILGPHLGVLLLPVAAYGLVLGAMAAFASARGRLIAIGGALFVVSDSVLALGRFLPGYDFALHDLTVMGTYLAAQGLITLGVILALRGAAPSRREPGRPVPATAP
ncbi:lysoplasmalogenase [Agromyces sp. LHK192]|uniref:lysoplasmalogenase n=1 Tax=Agromyces sp. LHK192 TaxID=2498704 RepID=UPI001F0BAC5A|nr:lysoplasmalogenase [Agromyces sp. LHK192]